MVPQNSLVSYFLPRVRIQIASFVLVSATNTYIHTPPYRPKKVKKAKASLVLKIELFFCFASLIVNNLLIFLGSTIQTKCKCILSEINLCNFLEKCIFSIFRFQETFEPRQVTMFFNTNDRTESVKPKGISKTSIIFNAVKRKN